VAGGLAVRASRPRLRTALAGPMAADWGPALLLTAFGQLNLRFGLDGSTPYGPPVAAAAVTAVATGVLVLRRRFPLTTVAVVAAGMALPELSPSLLTVTLWGDFVPLLVAVYSVARHANARRAVAGLALAALAIGVAMLRVPALGSVANIPFTGVPLAAVFVAGRVLRSRSLTHRRLEQAAEDLQRDRAAEIERAVGEERARIARELHDLVAHSVSVMVVQAGAAEDLLDRDPEAARAPLAIVQDTGRQAVGELSTMLGLLRRPADPTALEPQPDETAIPALVERMRAAGLRVDLRAAPLPPLPPSLGLALYRVVQEGLTNALKHAPGAAVAVTLIADERSVTAEIANGPDGTAAGAATGTGHGLIGVRERVAVHAGTMEARPTSGGGFLLRVTLPLPAGPGA
jgi:signal transduction histidine kinase